MRIAICVLATLCFATVASAQDKLSESLGRGTWDIAPFVGGGSGLGKSSNTQFLYAGVRGGWILTGNHLPGPLRGNFEWAVDAMPVYTFFTPNGTVYGGSFKPVIWQWNFTNGRKFTPYVAAAGGIVFTTKNIPPGDTSWVNFTPQFVLGTRAFTRKRHAIFFEGSLAHLSSASLGTHNPGYNVSLLLTIGYSWLKPPKLDLE